MSEVLRAVGIFCSYAVLAVFAQSAVFTRGLGVSRLVQLVGDDRTNSWWFALLLCVTQLLVAPLAFYAGQLIAPLANRAQLRPVVYVACVAVVCIFEHLVLRAVKGPRSGQLLRILPVAAINSCVLGTVLVESAPRALRWASPWGLAWAAAWATCWLSCWSRRRGTACAAGPSRRRSAACPSRSSTSACWRWPSMVLPDIL
mgnify:CR=1 FL=1